MTHKAFYITLAALTTAGLTLGLARTATAETIDCTPITTLPAVISTQGVWCLTSDLTTGITSGSAIEITTSNVTIDLNGWKLGGLAAGTATNAEGIASNGPNNITIRNGNVRGFRTGIELLGGQGHLVEDVRAERNTETGIQTSGNGSILRRNQVVDTGGSTRVADASAYGILVGGGGPRVLNNDIDGVSATGTGQGYGIAVFLATGGIVEDNRITGISGGTGTTAGITVSVADALVEHNLVAVQAESPDFGIYFNIGLGGYRNNYVYGATTAFSGGTSGGDNDSL
jgi:hypothetical protein